MSLDSWTIRFDIIAAMDHETASTRLEFIQALRGVAAAVVVLWHGSRFLAPYGTGASWWFQPGGAMGVTLFFLISGFIMVHTTHGSDGSWRAFWNFVVKRVTRIWPVWVIALTSYIVLLPDRLPGLDQPGSLRWLLGSLALVPVPGRGPGGPPTLECPALCVGWTLDYEVYFYAFFAVSLLFARWRWWAFFAWLIATLVMLPLFTGATLLPNLARWSPFTQLGFSALYLQLITNPIILLFAIGAMIGLLYKATRVTIRDSRLAGLLLALAFGVATVQWVTHFRIGFGVFECGLSLIPLVLVLCVASKGRRMPTPRWLVWLGNVSFSLYLFHPLVQEGFSLQNFRLPIALRDGVPAFSITTGLAVAVAAISYRLLERGLCIWLQDKLLWWRRAPVPSVASGVLTPRA